MCEPACQFNTIEWLRKRPYANADLRDSTLSSVTSFCLLWGVFECQLCSQSAGVSRFEYLAHRFDELGLLRRESLSSILKHCQRRYIEDNSPTHRFSKLHLRSGDRESFVLSVLRGEDHRLASIALALMIIVYRFRNNLFHGIKWVYELDEQALNLDHANRFLAWLIELSERADAPDSTHLRGAARTLSH